MKLFIISQIENDLASDDLQRALEQLSQLFEKLSEFELEDRVRALQGRLISHISRFNSGEQDYDDPCMNKIRFSSLELKQKLVSLLTRRGITTEQDFQALLDSKSPKATPAKPEPKPSPGFTISIGSISGGTINNAQTINQQVTVNKDKSND